MNSKRSKRLSTNVGPIYIGKLGEKNIDWFAAYFLSHYIDGDIPRLHHKFFSLTDEDRAVIAAPRGFAKSTVFSLVYPLWCLLYGKKKYIVLVSDTAYQAESFLDKIIWELETNELIHKYFGNLVGKDKWTKGEILAANGVRIIAKGTGQKIRGIANFQHRPDLVICDDLENDEMVRTKEQREKISSWFHRALLNTLAPESQVIIVGTVLHFDSLLANLLEKENWSTRKFKAIDENGRSVWRGKWPLSLLRKKKSEIGEIAFMSEYQNEPYDEQTAIFKKSWLQFYDIYPNQLDIYGGCDPAISTRDGADFFVFLTIGVDKEGRVYVLDYIRDHLTIDGQVRAIVQSYNRWQHKHISLETVAYQKALKQMLDLKSRQERLYLPVSGVVPDQDKIRRIQKITPLFENGFIYLGPKQQELIDELLEFPLGKHDDLLDALCFALANIKPQNVIRIFTQKSRLF